MSTNDGNNNDNQDKREARRSVVKGITIAGTGVTLTNWSKPVVETIVLPAHAQLSPGVAFTAVANF